MRKAYSSFSFMRGNVLVLTVCRMLYDTSLSIAWPFFPLYILALGGSGVEIGLSYALGGLGGLLLFPVGGYLADHVGRVKFIAVVSYILAFTHVFFIIAQDWILLAIGMFMQELSLFYLPAMNAITADSLPPEKRGIGFATIMAIPLGVTLLMPLVGGFVIDYVFGGGDEGIVIAMRIFFAVAMAVGFAVATIRLKFLKETLTKSDSGVPPRNILLLLKTSYKKLYDAFKWMSPTLWSIAIVAILTTMFTSLTGPFWSVFAGQVIGLTASEWGFLSFLVGAIRIVLAIPLGHLVDLHGTRRTILLSMLVAPIPIMLFPLCQTLPQVLVTLLVLATVNALLWPASAALIANVVPRERRGRLLSILGQGLSIGLAGGYGYGFLLYVPRIVGSITGGYLYTANPPYPWFILAVSVILCFALCFRFIHEPEKKET